MSLNRGTHYYAMCDGGGEDGQCYAFVLPEPTADPMGFGAIIAGRKDVFDAATAAGWQPEKQAGDPWFCPKHKPTPKAAASTPGDR